MRFTLEAHWQNPDPQSGYPTVWLASERFECSKEGVEAAMAWATALFGQRKAEMPERWEPMVRQLFDANTSQEV